MAVLTRSKSTVYGLDSDLLALQQADTQEVSNRESEISRVEGLISSEATRAIAAESTNATAISNEVSRATGEESRIESKFNSLTSGLDDRVTELEDVTVPQALSDAKAYADGLASVQSGDLSTLSSLVNTINGNSETEGSFRKAIADVIGTAPEALDTLKEIADAINNDANVYDTLVNLVNTGLSDLNQQILGTATEAMDTLGEVGAAIDVINGSGEGSLAKTLVNAKIYADSVVADEQAARESAVSVLTSNLASEITRAQAAEQANTDAIAALDADTYSKAETDSAIASGGAIFRTEVLVVTSDKITLSQAPKNGMIFNFATVRHTDANGVSYDIPAVVTATAGGKEFQLYGNTTGQFDGKSVTVQYPYTPSV